MASSKVALLLLGSLALAAVAAAQEHKGGEGYWEHKGFEKVDKGDIPKQQKPPKEPPSHPATAYPKKIVEKVHPPVFAPPQTPAEPRFFKPKFNKTFAPSPKPAKVQIIKVKEPKILDNTQPFKNNEKYPKPDFRKISSPTPKPAKVEIIKVKEPKIHDDTVPFKNNEKYPRPTFSKFYSPTPKPVKVIRPKVIEAPIKDITKAPPKVTKGWIDQPGKDFIKQEKRTPITEIFKQFYKGATGTKDGNKN